MCQLCWIPALRIGLIQHHPRAIAILNFSKAQFQMNFRSWRLMQNQEKKTILFSTIHHSYFSFHKVFDTKLRRLNRLRPKIHLKLDSNCLLIDYFNPNSSSKSISWWQIQLIWTQSILKSTKLIKKDKTLLIYINLVNIFWLFNSFNWLFKSFNWQLSDVFQTLNQK